MIGIFRLYRRGADGPLLKCDLGVQARKILYYIPVTPGRGFIAIAIRICLRRTRRSHYNNDNNYNNMTYTTIRFRSFRVAQITMI